VSLRDVWPAAFVAAIVWTLLKELFGLYLGSVFAQYSSTYGTLGAVFALITWIYLSSLIILTGAEFSAESARVRRLRREVAGLPSSERRPSPWLPSARHRTQGG
jgi:membrane protein